MIAPETLAEDIVDAIFAQYPAGDLSRRDELIKLIAPVIDMALLVDAEYEGS